MFHFSARWEFNDRSNCQVLNWDSVISLVSQLDILGVQFLAVARHFSLLQNVQTGSGAYPSSFMMGKWVPRVKWQGTLIHCKG